MYTFKVDIGNWVTPTVGGGYITAQPLFSEAQLTKGRGSENIRVRKGLSGSLEFLEHQFDGFKTLLDAGVLSVPLKVYADTVEQIEGEIELMGKWDEKAKSVKLSFQQNDNYTPILKNLDAKIALRSADTVVHSFITGLRNRYVAEEFGGSPSSFPGWDRYSLNGTYTTLTWTNTTVYTASQEIQTELWWGFDGVDSLVKYDPGAGYQYFVALQRTGPGTANGIKIPTSGGDAYWLRVLPAVDQYSQEYADFEFTGSEWIPEATESTDAHYDEWQTGGTSTNNYIKYIACRSLFYYLEQILGDIDSSIDVFFTTSGADTGHCEYIQTNYPNKLEKYIHSYEDEASITLQQIIDVFKNLHNCDWKLEGNIFVFRHASEVPNTASFTGVYNLAFYKSIDWTRWEFDFDVIDKVGKETWEQHESVVDDFNTMTINYDNAYEDKKEYKTPFWTDIKHALAEESDMFIIAAPGKILYNINVGIISGVEVFNGGLCTSQIVFDHFQEGRPFGIYEDWTGGDAMTLTQKRNNIITMQVPYLEILSQDIETYKFLTANGSVEIVEISIPMNGQMATLKTLIT